MESLFLTPAEHLSYISSSLVREIASFGGDVSKFVPAVVEQALEKKYRWYACLLGAGAVCALLFNVIVLTLFVAQATELKCQNHSSRATAVDP